MDFLKRIIVFVVAAIVAPLAMIIGSHLSFPVNNKLTTNGKLSNVTTSSMPVSFVDVKLNNGSPVLNAPENNGDVIIGNETQPVNQSGLYNRNKNSMFKLFYFSGKSVYETSLANLYKK